AVLAGSLAQPGLGCSSNQTAVTGAGTGGAAASSSGSSKTGGSGGGSTASSTASGPASSSSSGSSTSSSTPASTPPSLTTGTSTPPSGGGTCALQPNGAACFACCKSTFNAGWTQLMIEFTGHCCVDCAVCASSEACEMAQPVTGPCIACAKAKEGDPSSS